MSSMKSLNVTGVLLLLLVQNVYRVCSGSIGHVPSYLVIRQSKTLYPQIHVLPYVHLHQWKLIILYLFWCSLNFQSQEQVRDKFLILLDTWQEASNGGDGRFPQFFRACKDLQVGITMLNVLWSFPLLVMVDR